jgi:hypothetical protein
MCYNKMDFLKEEEVPGGHMAPFKPEREQREPRKTTRHNRVTQKPEEDI